MITFKKTTRTNNDFQSTLKKMLSDFNYNFNNDLELAQTDDKAIIIRYAHETFRPAERDNEDRTTIHLYNEYESEHKFVSLTRSQIRLLEWLLDEDFISDEWRWEEMEDIEIKKI